MMILLLIVGVMIFQFFLIRTGLPFEASLWITDLEINPKLIVALMLVIYIPLGMFLDGISMMAITLPVYVPVVQSLGFNPIWFGILVTIMCEVGLVTPPIGINVYVMKAVAPEVPMQTIFKACIPFLVMLFIGIAIIFFFPDIATVLPNMMMGD
jgi:TRAP-type C4-dicarboxylate transport system permease large subunit